MCVSGEHFVLFLSVSSRRGERSTSSTVLLCERRQEIRRKKGDDTAPKTRQKKKTRHRRKKKKNDVVHFSRESDQSHASFASSLASPPTASLPPLLFPLVSTYESSCDRACCSRANAEAVRALRRRRCCLLRLLLLLVASGQQCPRRLFRRVLARRGRPGGLLLLGA